MSKNYLPGFQVIETVEELEAFRREQKAEKDCGDLWDDETRVPSWDRDEELDPLLILKDDVEVICAQNVLRIRDKLAGALKDVRNDDSAQRAKLALDQAYRVVRQFIKAIKTLHRHSNKGMQAVIVLGSPAVGLNEKIARIQTSSMNNQQHVLAGFLETKMRSFYRRADFFEEKAEKFRSQINTIGETEYRRMNEPSNLSDDDVLKWSALSIQCMDIAVQLSDVMSSLVRRPQIVLKQNCGAFDGRAANVNEQEGEARNVR